MSTVTRKIVTALGDGYKMNISLCNVLDGSERKGIKRICCVFNFFLDYVTYSSSWLRAYWRCLKLGRQQYTILKLKSVWLTEPGSTKPIEKKSLYFVVKKEGVTCPNPVVENKGVKVINRFGLVTSLKVVKTPEEQDQKTRRLFRSIFG